MKDPKISVITPSYNQGIFIEETILSILNQNYANLEYIIIDGGSTDNTVDIIKKYESHIAFWVSEKDSGQSEAINKGFKKATGDIICWINSDDILLPNALTKVADSFKANIHLELLNGHLLIIDQNSHIITNYLILKPLNWYARRGIYYVAQQSMFWKRSLLERIGYINEEFHAMMDREFLIRVFKNNCNVGHTKQILGAIRKHETTKTALNGSIWSQDEMELQRRYINDYGQKPKLFYKIIYGVHKLSKGLYFHHWLFKLKWKGKHVTNLKAEDIVFSV